jgi:hypothetical protein
MFASGTSTFNNCFVCLLESPFDIFRLIFPLRGTCQHSKNSKPSQVAYYRISKNVVLLDILFSTVLLFSWITYFIYPFQMCETDKARCLLLLSDQMLVTISIVIGFLELFYMKMQTLEFNAWTRTIEKIRFYGLKEILSEESARRFIFLRNLGMIAVSIWGIAGTSLTLGISYDTTPWHWGRKFLLVVCYTLQSYVTLDLGQKIRIVGIVLDTFKRTLMSSLTNNSYPIFAKKRGEMTLEKILGRYTNLVLVIHTNMNLFMRYFFGILILYSMALLASLIINIYVLIEFNDYNIYILLVIEVRTILLIVRVVFVFIAAEINLKNKVGWKRKGPKRAPCGALFCRQQKPFDYCIDFLTNQVIAYLINIYSEHSHRSH